MLFKLILCVSTDESGQIRRVDRPMLYPAVPRIGESFLVSKSLDYIYVVADIIYCPSMGMIEVHFNAESAKETTMLLNENGGGWLRNDNVGYNPIALVYQLSNGPQTAF